MATTNKADAKKKVSTKKAASKKTTTKQKAAKPKEDLVVFAFRLTETERTKIHAAAGPANASRFIRHIAIAFANEDVKAFQAVLKEARELRS